MTLEQFLGTLPLEPTPVPEKSTLLGPALVIGDDVRVDRGRVARIMRGVQLRRYLPEHASELFRVCTVCDVSLNGNDVKEAPTQLGESALAVGDRLFSSPRAPATPRRARSERGGSRKRVAD
jgi:hypothetical protein